MLNIVNSLNMNTDVQPLPNKDGEVVAQVNRRQQFQAGPSLAEIEARKTSFANLKKMDPSKARKVETGVWSPRKDDELIGNFLGIATLTRKPRNPDEQDEQKRREDAGEDGYVDGLIPFPAAAIETESGVRFLSMTIAMEKFGSGQIAQGSGVYVKCEHAKAGEMTLLDVRVLRDGPEAIETDAEIVG